VVAFALAVYAPTLVFARIGYDDFWLWSDTSPLRHLDARVLHDVWCELRYRHPFGSEYLPVRDLLVAADMAVWGDGEHGPHLTQWLLYGLLVWSLGTLLVRWGFSRRVAWLATLLWAVHPLGVQSVSWLSERKGILAALFVVACGHAWARYRAGSSRAWLAAAAALAVCGVWSKAPAMFAVAALSAWDQLLLPRSPRRWSAIGVVGAISALAAVPVFYVASQVGVVAEAEGVHVARAIAPLAAQGHYVLGLVLARHPSLSYPLLTDGPGALELVVGALAVAASVAIALRCRNRQVLAALAWAWIWFVPISQLIAPVHIFVADRYAFVWLIGPCLGAALAIDRFGRLAGTTRLAVAGALVCLLGVLTVRAEGRWASSRELFMGAIADNPRDPQMQEDLAIALVDEVELVPALKALDRALAIRPREPHLLVRRSEVLAKLGRTDEALATAQQAAASGLSSAAWAYAALLLQLHRAGDARWWAERAARFHPEREDYQQTYALVCVELERWTDAERPLRTAIEIHGHAAVDHLWLARVLAKQGRPVEARAQLDLARRDRSLAKEITALESSLR
jgi:tetratricopeptide (TPR) repeat protein